MSEKIRPHHLERSLLARQLKLLNGRSRLPSGHEEPRVRGTI